LGNRFQTKFFKEHLIQRIRQNLARRVPSPEDRLRSYLAIRLVVVTVTQTIPSDFHDFICLHSQGLSILAPTLSTFLVPFRDQGFLSIRLHSAEFDILSFERAFQCTEFNRGVLSVTLRINGIQAKNNVHCWQQCLASDSLLNSKLGFLRPDSTTSCRSRDLFSLPLLNCPRTASQNPTNLHKILKTLLPLIICALSAATKISSAFSAGGPSSEWLLGELYLFLSHYSLASLWPLTAGCRL